MAEEPKPLPMSSSLSSGKSDPALSPKEVDELSAELQDVLHIRRGRPKKETENKETENIDKELVCTSRGAGGRS